MSENEKQFNKIIEHRDLIKKINEIILNDEHFKDYKIETLSLDKHKDCVNWVEYWNSEKGKYELRCAD